MLNQLKLIAAAFVMAGGVAGTAQAQSTWNYATFTQNATNANTYGNSYSTTLSGTKLTVSAYSSTGSGGTFATANLANYGSGSGFGVKNQIEGLSVTAPNHAMDNSLTTDMLALNFTNSTTAAQVSVALTSLTTGWHNTGSVYTCGSTGTSLCGTDADISLLRWTGSTGPTITGGTIATLLSAGWALVDNYANMVDDAARATGVSTSTGSSWWLISAYNSAWGTGSSTSGLSNGDDFVKVLASVTTVSTPPPGVPEPGSLALAALALLGLGAARRAKRA